MSRYKAYPEYKDSGVEWLGRVPAYWLAKRFKQALIDKKKTSNPLLEAGSISFGRVVFKDSDSLSQETKDSYQEVLSGEYLINPLNLNYDLLSLRTALSEIDVVVSTGYIVLKSNGILSPRYIRWLLHEFDVAHMKTLGAGVRQTINYSDIGNSYFCAPTEVEQDAISTFLDHETAKIDALIEKQQRLIELLKEKRQAVISHAVTKGLNPNAPMKDSGVEWLGEVPAHWEVPKLLYRTSRIGDGLHAAPRYQDGTGIYFINGNNLVDGEIVVGATAKEVPQAEYENNYIELNSSTVLLSINGTVGNTALYREEKVILGKSAAYINCQSCLMSEYLMLYLQSENARRHYEQEVTGTTIYNLSLNSIRKIRVCIPPKLEQAGVVDFCTTQKNKYNALICQANSAIELMQERRTALISAAVTGKIDVRDWQTAV